MIYLMMAINGQNSIDLFSFRMYGYLKLIHACINNFQSCVSYLLRYIQASNSLRVICGNNMGAVSSNEWATRSTIQQLAFIAPMYPSRPYQKHVWLAFCTLWWYTTNHSPTARLIYILQENWTVLSLILCELSDTQSKSHIAATEVWSKV
jgi:hypothetical protein